MFDELGSDADRLASIKGLGGRLVECAGQTCWAIFDAEFSEVLGDPSVETSSPALSSVRSIDVAALGMKKDVDIKVAGENYRVRRVQSDGAGMSLVWLKRS